MKEKYLTGKPRPLGQGASIESEKDVQMNFLSHEFIYFGLWISKFGFFVNYLEALDLLSILEKILIWFMNFGKVVSRKFSNLPEEMYGAETF